MPPSTISPLPLLGSKSYIGLYNRHIQHFVIDQLHVRHEEFNHFLVECDITPRLPQSTWNCTGCAERNTLNSGHVSIVPYMLLKRILDKFRDSAKHVEYRMEKFEQRVREL